VVKYGGQTRILQIHAASQRLRGTPHECQDLQINEPSKLQQGLLQPTLAFSHLSLNLSAPLSLLQWTLLRTSYSLLYRKDWYENFHIIGTDYWKELV
jgi:hypothetical protein